MKKNYAKKFYLGAVLMAFMVLLWGTISYAQVLATGTQDYRNQVVYVCGISNLDNLSEPCTRKEFAQMLVMASSQKDQAASSQTAAAVDVPGSNEYAKYIRIALRNGWMRTRISGGFEPESIVTLNDAAKAAMSMLGYTDSDFPGNVSEGRLAKFTALSLGDGINASVGTAQLTKQEALNIVYNMLKAKGKNSGSIYGTCINLTLGTDGELNATNVLDDTMQGPVLIKNYNELKTMIPFDVDTANCYYNGAKSSYYTNLQLLSYSSQISNFGWIIIYYNEATKTVWGYGADTGSSAYHCVRGTVNAVYYDSDNIVSPTSVLLGDTTYKLSGADVKFMFSINGTVGIGDEVVLICKTNVEGNTDVMGENTDMNSAYYATGVVIYHKKGEK